MSNIAERKRKLKELLAYAKKTSWRRKSLEKRIGEITTYLLQSVDFFSVTYSDMGKVVNFSAYVRYMCDIRTVTINPYLTSTSINREILIFLEQLLNDFHYYEQQE